VEKDRLKKSQKVLTARQANHKEKMTATASFMQVNSRVERQCEDIVQCRLN